MNRAALRLIAIFLLIVGLACPASAQTTKTAWEKQIGTDCNNGSASADFDTLAQCTSTSATNGLMQKAPLFVGQVTSPPYASTACDAAKAGMLQYVSGSLQYCNGTAWTAFSPGTGTASSLFTVITATVTGANGGTAAASCPAGYVLMSYGLVTDHRTDNGTDGWNNGGVTDCYPSGGALIAALSAYSGGSTQSRVACAGLCVANGIPGVNYLGSSAISTGPSRSDDITTGLFSATASTVSIATGGTERLRVTATGSVGIGTTAPIEMVQITGSGTTRLVVSDASSTGEARVVASGADAYIGASTGGNLILQANRTNQLIVTATGSVGIGTASPSFKLTNSAQTNIVGGMGVGLGGNNSFVWEHPASDSTTGYAMGILNSMGSGGNGLTVKTTNATSSTNILEASSGSATRLLVRADGNVGIGTTTPSERLDLGGGNIVMGYTTVSCAFLPAQSGWLSCVCPAGKRVLGASCRYSSGGGPLGFDIVDVNNSNSPTGASCYKTGTSDYATMYVTCANIK